MLQYCCVTITQFQWHATIFNLYTFEALWRLVDLNWASLRWLFSSPWISHLFLGASRLVWKCVSYGNGREQGSESNHISRFQTLGSQAHDNSLSKGNHTAKPKVKGCSWCRWVMKWIVLNNNLTHCALEMSDEHVYIWLLLSENKGSDEDMQKP